MEIVHHQEDGYGHFEAIINGRQAGLMTYSQAGKEKIIIDHTEVGSDFGGLGVGKALVMEAVAHVRANDMQIMPLCPFAKSVFQKTPELEDVWFK